MFSISNQIHLNNTETAITSYFRKIFRITRSSIFIQILLLESITSLFGTRAVQLLQKRSVQLECVLHEFTKDNKNNIIRWNR